MQNSLCSKKLLQIIFKRCIILLYLHSFAFLSFHLAIWCNLCHSSFLLLPLGPCGWLSHESGVPMLLRAWKAELRTNGLEIRDLPQYWFTGVSVHHCEFWFVHWCFGASTTESQSRIVFLAKLSQFQCLGCFINGAIDTDTIAWAVRIWALEKLEKAFSKLFFVFYPFSVEILVIFNNL